MVVHHYPPRHQAGVELIARRAAHWLQHEGHEVEVVCVESIDTGRPGLECTRDLFEGVPVHRLAYDIGHLEDRFRASYDNALIGAWMDTYLGQTMPDLVHAQSCYLTSVSPVRAAGKLNIPTVLSLHDYWTLCHWVTLRHPDGTRCSGDVTAADCAWCLMTEKRRYRIPDRVSRGAMGGLVKWAGRVSGVDSWRRRLAAVEDRQRTVAEAVSQVDQLTVSSRFLQERIRTLYGITEDHLSLITYGLDLSARRRLPKTTADGVLRIGYIGQLSPQKGVHVLLDAFDRLRPTGRRPRLSLYGDSSEQPRYVRALKQKAEGNPDILFAGRFDNAQVAEIYQEIDVLVVPSQWYETGPLVTWEAFASKTPVVATDLPNMRYQVRHEVDGLLFAPDECDDLAHQLQRLLDRPELVEQMASRIRPVKTHADEMEQIVTVYQRAVRGIQEWD
jgi:glycosyltransferase involved in cell wall biosynthesis